MARCHNVKDQIKQLLELPHRSIVLIDEVTKETPFFGLFDRVYEVKNTFVDLTLFEATKNVLKTSSDTKIHSIDDLPILEHLGSWKTTVIIRKLDNSFLYKNGESIPTELLMGLE